MPTINTITINYVALGDSLANGVGANHQGYPQQLHDLLSAKKPTTFQLHAVSGQTSHQLLKRWPTYAEAIAQANLITWNIGGNDLRLTWRMYGHSKLPTKLKNKKMELAITKLANNWNMLAQKIRQSTPPQAVVIALNQYNPYQANHPETDRFIRQANKQLEMICQNHNIILIDTYKLINTNKNHPLNHLLAGDNLHLNTTGYNLIATEMYDLLFPQSLWQKVRQWFGGGR